MLLSPKIHRYIFLFGLCALGGGMLFGTVTTSIPELVLVGNWLLSGEFRLKGARLRNSRLFFVLSLLFLLHVLGLLYTSDWKHGMDEIRNKVPLLVLPLIFFSTTPLSTKEFKACLLVFVSGVFISSICCMSVYLGFTKKVIVDVRDASVFMSHIRFSLFITLAIVVLFYFWLQEKGLRIRTLCVGLMTWLMGYMALMEMVTGIVILALLVFFYLVYRAFSQTQKTYRSLAMLVLILLLGGTGWFLKSEYVRYHTVNPYPANQVLEKSPNGAIYLQDTLYKVTENGNYITINIAFYEMQQVWKRRSKLPFDGKDKRGNTLSFTILRYLASKGLTKDSLALSSLSEEEIHHIENGIPNYLYANSSGIRERIQELFWELDKYSRGENPSGHTLTMRLEFWKTGFYIIRQHPWIGVGTGDIQQEYNKAYKETHTRLDPKWWLRCHNQYLAIAVAFGVLGLLIFLFYLIYPLFWDRWTLHPLYLPFFLIACLSFFTEDTLETQSGVTFFAFFNTLFLWQRQSKSKR